MKITFLPPNISRAAIQTAVNDHWSDTLHQSSSMNRRTAMLALNRVYKSPQEIVYEIESSETDSSRCADADMADSDIILAAKTQTTMKGTQSGLVVSSQADPTHIHQLYRKLGLTTTGDVTTDASRSLHVFGVIVEIEAVRHVGERQIPCASLCICDLGNQHARGIRVRLWRQLSGWVNSLLVGDCIQVRNLKWRDDGELVSTVHTQIFLLAHSPHTARVGRPSLSARISHLSEDERQILIFLRHQTLRLPNSTHVSHVIRAAMTVIMRPVTLERCGHVWMLAGVSDAKNVSVQFVHLDAHVWLQLNVIMERGFAGLVVECRQLTVDGTFIASSQLSVRDAECAMDEVGAMLSFERALSAKVMLNGLYRMYGVLEACLLDSEWSMDSSLITSQPLRSSLLDPAVPTHRVFLDGHATDSGTSCEVSWHALLVRSHLSDPYSDELLRRSFHLLPPH